ncbi:hypothetical protein ACP70R_009524 [Stipagrostis hirtigluma subsp. patula]
MPRSDSGSSESRPAAPSAARVRKPPQKAHKDCATQTNDGLVLGGFWPTIAEGMAHIPAPANADSCDIYSDAFTKCLNNEEVPMGMCGHYIQMLYVCRKRSRA